MRWTLAVKLLLIYVLVCSGFLGLLYRGTQTLDHVSGGARQLVEQEVQRALLVRDLRTALTQLDRSIRIYQLREDALSNDGVRQARRAFERQLRRMERFDAAAYATLDRLFQDYLSSVFAGEVAVGLDVLKPAPLSRLQDQIDALVDEADGHLRQQQNRLLDLPPDAVNAMVLGFLACFALGFLGFSLFILRLQGSLRQVRGLIDGVAQGDVELQTPSMARDEVGDLADATLAAAHRVKATRQMFLDASPLTYLPGNIAIERALLERLRREETFALCYIDLDDFKPYNDHYGYAKGSEVIKATAEIIHQAQKEAGSRGDFVGHIGGDDFVLVTDMEHIHSVCAALIKAFDAMIPHYYSEEDRSRGYIESKDRYGQQRQFPIMTISVAVVTNAQREIHDPLEIARVAAEIKEYVKLLPGSNYLIDRRQKSR